MRVIGAYAYVWVQNVLRVSTKAFARAGTETPQLEGGLAFPGGLVPLRVTSEHEEET
jgi:hypothetical protein